MPLATNRVMETIALGAGALAKIGIGEMIPGSGLGLIRGRPLLGPLCPHPAKPLVNNLRRMVRRSLVLMLTLGSIRFAILGLALCRVGGASLPLCV